MNLLCYRYSIKEKANLIQLLFFQSLSIFTLRTLFIGTLNLKIYSQMRKVSLRYLMYQLAKLSKIGHILQLVLLLTLHQKYSYLLGMIMLLIIGLSVYVCLNSYVDICPLEEMVKVIHSKFTRTLLNLVVKLVLIKKRLKRLSSQNFSKTNKLGILSKDFLFSNLN